MSSQPTLFVSYRRSSQLQRVWPVVMALQEVGVECFLDVKDIEPLSDFPDRIRAAIDRSHALLVWWSMDYGDSDMCLQEFRRGWQHARRQSSDLERRIWVVNPEATAHHISAGELCSKNLIPPPDPGEGVGWANRLLRRLQALLPEGPLAEERHREPVPVLYNVPVSSPDFTGRAAEMLNIHTKLHPARSGSSGAAVVVQTHGMPGVGKPELATAYARDFALAFPGGVYWLNLATWQPSDNYSSPRIRILLQ